MIDKVTEASLLFDFYGNLLSDRKRQVMELYYGEDLSLSEIADEFQISRSAVHDSLKSAEKSLEKYEAKLGLMKRFLQREDAIREIEGIISQLVSEHQGDVELKSKLGNILEVINEIDR